MLEELGFHKSRRSGRSALAKLLAVVMDQFPRTWQESVILSVGDVSVSHVASRLFLRWPGSSCV